MDDKNIKFEENLKKIQQIVEQLEKGEIGIDELVEKFGEGKKIIDMLTKKLEEIEQKVSQFGTDEKSEK